MGYDAQIYDKKTLTLKDFKHLSRKSQPPATNDISAHPTNLENSGDV